MNIFKAMVLSIIPAGRTIVAKELQHERDILAVMSVLDTRKCRYEKYRYKQVEAAVNASSVSARDIYEGLLSDQYTGALGRFYEALDGPV